MTDLETPVAQSIQQAIGIIQQGRALERLLLDAGFTLAESTDAPAPESPANPEPESAKATEPDWPRPDPFTNDLIDVRGVPWIEAAHSAAKTCNSDGTWRRKRGVDQAEVEQLEAAERARPHLAADPELEPEPEQALDLDPELEQKPEPIAPDVSDFDTIRAGIECARNQMEIDSWWDHSREAVITQSQRYALSACVEERQRQLAAEQRIS